MINKIIVTGILEPSQTLSIQSIVNEETKLKEIEFVEYNIESQCKETNKLVVIKCRSYDFIANELLKAKSGLEKTMCAFYGEFGENNIFIVSQITIIKKVF